MRESKGKAKAQKGNKRPKTKDISGRRLRTKDKSSANRANIGIQQPDPYWGRKRTQSDKAAKPQGRIFSEPPREQNQRAWTGDISGKPIRRINPSKSGVARSNVYPQKGPYVNYGSEKGKKAKPKVYTRTASGDFPVNSTPQNKQRAWKGNIKGGAVGTPSRSGQIKNTYKQFGEYGNHPSRKPQNSDRIQSGRIGTSRTLRASSSPWSTRKKKVNLSSGSRSFLTRGKKNVYWGKISKSGKAVTTDITGRPLRTRNFRSAPPGLVARDTLRTFGRRPGGDKATKQTGGGFVSKRKGQHAWGGDISGKKLRGTKPRINEAVGEFFFPRKLSISTNGEVGQPLQGGGISEGVHKRKKVETNNLPPRSPGIGASSFDRFFANIKGRRPIKGGGSVSGKRWNNNGEPIGVNRAGAGTIRASKFQGNYKIGELGPGFSSQGAGWQGNVKGRRPLKGGGSVSGKLWNNNEQPLAMDDSGTSEAGKFQGKVKEGNLFKRGYVQNPNASKASIKKQHPDETTFVVTGLQVKVKERDYKEKPKAADGSLRGIAPYKSSVKASEYASSLKKYWDNKHNPNSADDAIKVFYPGKAIAQFGDYQGNVKMHKYKDSRLHPDSKFAHSFRDNVKEERTFLINVKLFWSKVFRKSETQPEHLKEKIRRPRYDKGEEGMWYN